MFCELNYSIHNCQPLICISSFSGKRHATFSIQLTTLTVGQKKNKQTQQHKRKRKLSNWQTDNANYRLCHWLLSIANQFRLQVEGRARRAAKISIANTEMPQRHVNLRCAKSERGRGRDYLLLLLLLLVGAQKAVDKTNRAASLPAPDSLCICVEFVPHLTWQSNKGRERHKARCMPCHAATAIVAIKRSRFCNDIDWGNVTPIEPLSISCCILSRSQSSHPMPIGIPRSRMLRAFA